MSSGVWGCCSGRFGVLHGGVQDEALGAAAGCIMGEMHREGDGFGGAQGYTLGGLKQQGAR